jgi:hypothetical protein
MRELSGKRVLITGAADGIGRGPGRVLDDRGLLHHQGRAGSAIEHSRAGGPRRRRGRNRVLPGIHEHRHHRQDAVPGLLAGEDATYRQRYPAEGHEPGEDRRADRPGGQACQAARGDDVGREGGCTLEPHLPRDCQVHPTERQEDKRPAVQAAIASARCNFSRLARHSSCYFSAGSSLSASRLPRATSVSTTGAASESGMTEASHT